MSETPAKVSRRELEEKLIRFLDTFERVFNYDWEHTQIVLRSSTHYSYISEDGTFLFPDVESERDNWWNRGSLLSRYRDLTTMVRRRCSTCEKTYRGPLCRCEME
jgi:hypothetical protein